jgi:hypothetical protein
VEELIQHLILDQNQLKDEKSIKIMTKLRLQNLKQQKIKRQNCKSSRKLSKGSRNQTTVKEEMKNNGKMKAELDY